MNSVLITIIGIALWALIPGNIAKKKGRSFWAYYLLSFLITPLITIIITLVLSPVPNNHIKANVERHNPEQQQYYNERPSTANNVSIISNASSGRDMITGTRTPIGINNDVRIASQENGTNSKQFDKINYWDELRMLKNLADEGVITMSDFEQKKQQILGTNLIAPQQNEVSGEAVEFACYEKAVAMSSFRLGYSFGFPDDRWPNVEEQATLMGVMVYYIAGVIDSEVASNVAEKYLESGRPGAASPKVANILQTAYSASRELAEHCMKKYIGDFDRALDETFRGHAIMIPKMLHWPENEDLLVFLENSLRAYYNDISCYA